MPRTKLTKKEQRQIDNLVVHFEEHKFLFEGNASSLVEACLKDDELAKFIHFIKFRVKSPNRLRSKLEKKFLKQPAGSSPPITEENLFQEINDLAGVRILHLHTEQMDQLNKSLTRVIENEKFEVIEGPIANCWDVEYENLFNGYGIETTSRD